MALSKNGKKRKAARAALKRDERRQKQQDKSEERKADRIARGLPAVAPKPPKKTTTWSGQNAPLPPPQLIDAIHEWLRDYRYVKAAHGMRTDNQKRPGHNMMLWKGTATGLPQLNEIFMQWKEQNPDLAKADHEREAEAKDTAQDSESSDSDDDSSSDSDGDSSEEAENSTAPSVPAVSAGMKRKADDISDSSSSADSDSDDDSSSSGSSSGSDADSTDEPAKVTNDATTTTGGSDSSTTIGRASVEPAAKPSVKAEDSVASEASDDASSSDSDSDSSSDSDSPSPASAVKDEAEPDLKASSASSDSSSSRSSSSSDSDSDSTPDSEAAAPKTQKPASNGTIASQSTLTANGAPAAKRARPDTAAKQGPPLPNKPFSRIADDVAVDQRFSSNAYVPYDYADRAHADLSVVRGKGFTKEKNKKKRGQGFRGGAIDMTSRAVKFED